MSKNFGKTQQELPNFKMPLAIETKGAVGRQSLIGLQTDILNIDSLYGAAIDQRDLDIGKGAGNLKQPLSKATKSYKPKRSHKPAVYRQK